MTAERGARVRFPPPLVFLGCTITAVLVQRYVMPLGLDQGRPASTVAGVMLMVLGITSVVSARVLFFRTRQNPVPWTPTPELIAQGPYRFTRNPMYVGITTLLVGVGITSDVLWISLFALVALALVHLIAVVPEEAYLRDRFGEAYTGYVARVRRYI